jgi:hypothetical protein
MFHVEHPGPEIVRGRFTWNDPDLSFRGRFTWNDRRPALPERFTWNMAPSSPERLHLGGAAPVDAGIKGGRRA